MESIIKAVTLWVTTNITNLGYYGIVIMMGIESACIPLPSEIIMPFGGYLVYKDPARFSIWWMGVAGALGCVWGSVVAYWAGKYGGRPFVMRYGRFILVRERDLDKADAWFKRHGDAAIFFSRLLPVVRTFISFPAGISGMRFGRFIIYTFLGSLPWCLALAYLGKVLGEQWDTRLKGYFHGADAVIIAVFAVLIALYIWHHIKGEREYQAAKRE
ncbi:MAG: DedA family protein [Armatimonadetes bacterium]|nr:DedA family protein [Armatimonadota bacterium]